MFSIKGTRCATRVGWKAEFCAQHKQDGMINVVDKRCGDAGCTKGARYGKVGGKHECCFQHKQDAMFSRAELAAMPEERREKEEIEETREKVAFLLAEMKSYLSNTIHQLKLSKYWLLAQLGKTVIKQEKPAAESLLHCTDLMDEVEWLKEAVWRKRAQKENSGATEAPQQQRQRAGEASVTREPTTRRKAGVVLRKAKRQKNVSAKESPPKEGDVEAVAEQVAALKAKNQSDMRELVETLEPRGTGCCSFSTNKW